MKSSENGAVFAARKLNGEASGIRRGGFFRCVRAELIKLRHSAMWFAVFALPLIGVLIGTGNYFINAGALTGDPWFDLWTQVALFFGYFFYPVLAAVVAGYLWRVEHFDHNWNGLMTTPVSASSIWFSKLFVLFIMAALCQAVNILMYWAAGAFILRLPGSMPSYWWWWMVGGPSAVMAGASIQSYLSMRIRSFAVPVGISLALCVIGIACYSRGIWFFPNTLAIIGINAQHEGLPTIIDMTKVLGGTVFWIAAASFAGIRYLEKTDVKSER